MGRFVRGKFSISESSIQIRVPEARNLTIETSRVPPLPSTPVILNGVGETSSSLVNGIGDGGCVKGRCGAEAACRPLDGGRHQCVCPHDSSPPTEDLRCPNRITVPITPKPIHNIIPPAGSNDTTNGTIITTSSQKSLAYPEKNVDVRILAGGLAVSALVSIIVLIIIIYLWRRRSCSKINGIEAEKSNPYSPSPLKKSLLLNDRYTINAQYTPCVALTVPLLQSDTLTFQHEIGEGCFGKVFKGELRNEDTDIVEAVAIKVLKDSANKKAEEDFMREVDIMSAFRHENILTLIGVVLKEPGMSPMMVFEYMDLGDLAEVLRQNARPFATVKSNSSKITSAGTLLDGRGLLSIALQIADGMRYLASQRFVHRDLACRNCLVASGLIVKIADFGMSRDVYTCDYYKIGGSRLLPVRWMAPESVLYGKFTLESDIWSYGVVLWEIYSYGKQPYFGHTNEEVLQLVMQGTMLTIPDSCPPYINKLIQSCWKTDPKDRIPFIEIYDELKSALDCFDSIDLTSLVNEMKQKTLSRTNLPRPPLKPISHFGDLLDAEGYLLPQEGTKVNYLETMEDL